MHHSLVFPHGTMGQMVGYLLLLVVLKMVLELLGEVDIDGMDLNMVTVTELNMSLYKHHRMHRFLDTSIRQDKILDLQVMILELFYRVDTHQALDEVILKLGT